MTTPQSPRYNQNQSNIVELFGGSSWEEISAEYANKNENEILEALDYMWPQDDNSALATNIYNELN